MPEMMTTTRLLKSAVPSVVLLLALVGPVHSQTRKACKPVQPMSDAQQFARIKEPGCYVLSQPFRQGRWFVLSEGGWRSSGFEEMIETLGTDIEIDLAGLSLRSNDGVGGVTANAGRYVVKPGHYADEYVPLGPDEVHRIHIRNGTIDLTDSKGYSGPGVIAPNGLNSSVWLVHDLSRPEPLPTSFRKVEYVLENLTIKAPGEAAMLMGDGIVIRNCTIEVKAGNALIIYGPNAVIENNRIVYRFNGDPDRDRRRTPGHYPELRSAIYLRGANKAVVRNNTINVSWWDHPVSAVAVVESKDVLIEGNRFNTDVTPVVLSGPSSATLRRNEFEGGWFSKKRMLPDALLRHQ